MCVQQPSDLPKQLKWPLGATIGSCSHCSNVTDRKMCSNGTSKKKRFPVAKVKGGWTLEEDEKLVELVKEHGVRKWSYIAGQLHDRIGKQCRERWFNHLRPDIKSSEWTDEEEMRLVNAHKKYGNKWAAIARMMNGRTENAVKNHWNATLRRKDTMQGGNSRKSPTSEEEPTALRDYLRELYGWNKDGHACTEIMTTTVAKKKKTSTGKRRERKSTSEVRERNRPIAAASDEKQQVQGEEENNHQLVAAEQGTPVLVQNPHASYAHSMLEDLMLQWEDEVAGGYSISAAKTVINPLEDQLECTLSPTDCFKFGGDSPDTVLLSPAGQYHMNMLTGEDHLGYLDNSATSSSSTFVDELCIGDNSLQRRESLVSVHPSTPSVQHMAERQKMFGFDMGGLDPIPGDSFHFASTLDWSKPVGSPRVDKRRRVETSLLGYTE